MHWLWSLHRTPVIEVQDTVRLARFLDSDTTIPVFFCHKIWAKSSFTRCLVPAVQYHNKADSTSAWFHQVRFLQRLVQSVLLFHQHLVQPARFKQSGFISLVLPAILPFSPPSPLRREGTRPHRMHAPTDAKEHAPTDAKGGCSLQACLLQAACKTGEC